MTIDESRLESLLTQVRAVAEGSEQDYQQAFGAANEAIEMLLKEREDWRQMVARATEEYQGDEGI
jgi:hypothetical protein